MKKTFLFFIFTISLCFHGTAQIDTTSRNTGVPNFGRTIILADSVAQKRISDSTQSTQNIYGVKSFSPAVKSASNVGRGVIINPTFTADSNGDVFACLYVGPATVSNNTSYPLVARYSAIFDGSVSSPLFQGTALRTNTITRNLGTSAMTVLKPSANIAHQFIFDGRTDTGVMKSNTAMLSSTYFRDSITFRSNTHAAGYSQALFQSVLVQTGYSGVTRSIYVNPVLTDVTNFRGIETNVSAANSWAYYGAGSAPSLFAGKLFIGDTTTSSSKLVVNTARPGNEMGQVGIGKTSSAGAITFMNSAGSGFGLVGYRTSVATGDFVISSAGGAGNLTFMTGGTDKMIVTTAGNVGIGTTSPQAKLAVNGDVYAKRVKVTTSGWADYVFDSSYTLPMLSALENYIQKHKHLPEIPTAEEIQKNGADVGENQVVLLKKIEELTLYIIEQNKKAEKLQQQLQAEHSRNERMESRLAELEKKVGMN